MIDMEKARGLVARCWCDKRTSHLEMDADLAEVFAERLVKLINSAEALYKAGHWKLSDDRIDTTEDEQFDLWADLGDALGLDVNKASVDEVDTAKIVSGQTVSMTTIS